jgi:sec-independent protein translocase protein TatA
MELSPMHLILLLAIIVLLFGGKKIPEVMRGLGEGVRSFKEGMREHPSTPEGSTPAPPAATTSLPEKK